MPLEVFTEPWAQACCQAINADEGYRAAGAEWEEPVVLVMQADAERGIAEDRAFFLDLHRGVCSQTRPATAEDLATTPYVLAAGPAAWEQILGGRLDAVSALMTGRLRLLRGGVFALAKHAGAAKELVRVAGSLDAVFPGA